MRERRCWRPRRARSNRARGRRRWRPRGAESAWIFLGMGFQTTVRHFGPLPTRDERHTGTWEIRLRAPARHERTVTVVGGPMGLYIRGRPVRTVEGGGIVNARLRVSMVV